MNDDYVSSGVYRVSVEHEDDELLEYLEDMRNSIAALTDAAERIAEALEKAADQGRTDHNQN